MHCRTVKLNNNKIMPMVGLGTWMILGDSKVEESIRNAIKCGYKQIDTAFIYENEKSIGKALKKVLEEGVIKREELFITSKLWSTYHDNPEKGLRTTLKDLQLNYIDLYLVHWPVKFKSDENCNAIRDEHDNKIIDKFECLELWKKMESLVENGLTKSIGVANYGKCNLELILKHCKIKPVINQFEIHPYLTQTDLVDYCQKNNVHVTSYSSLGGSNNSRFNLHEDPELLKLAKKYKKSVAQVVLSWLVMRDILIIPKSSSLEHLKENMDLFELDEVDYNQIFSLNKNLRFVENKSAGPDRFK